MPDILSFEAMRKVQDQKLSFTQMKAQQDAWKPPTAEEEAIEEDWTVFAAGAVALATAPTLGIPAAITAGVTTFVGDKASEYLGRVAGEVHPSLEIPVYIGAGILSAFTLEKWLIDRTVKAATKIPQFWSKEFALAERKGMLSKEFVDNTADIVARMDMGDKKATEQMLNLFRQDVYQEKMIKVGRQLEKIQKAKPSKVIEPINKVIEQLKKKKHLRSSDYLRLSSIARDNATLEYNTKFIKLRSDAVAQTATEKWRSSKMKDAIELVIKDGGIPQNYKFASPELAELFVKRHPKLMTKAIKSANLEKIADDFGYTVVDDMISDIYHTPSKVMFRRLASAELAPEFNRIYRDEILVRVAEKEADYLFKLHGVTKEVGSEKLIKLRYVETLRRASNTLPARLVIKEVNALKKSVSQLLKIIQKPTKDTAKLQRLKSVYDTKLAEYQAATKIKKELGLINQRLKHAKSTNPEYQEQLQKFLAPLFKKPIKKVDEAMFSFLVRKYHDEVSIGADLLIKKYDGLLKTYPFRANNFMELTYEQAKDLDEFVKAFKFVAQNDKYIYEKAEKILIKTMAKEINKTASTTISKVKIFRPRMTGTQLEDLGKFQDGKFVNARRSVADVANGALAWTKRIEAICYQLDGFKVFGRAWKNIFNKTIMAEVAKERLGKQVFGKYEKIFATHKAATKINPIKYWSATSGTLAGRPIRKEFAVFMALNSKNVDNMKSMLEGLNIPKEKLLEFLETALNKADRKFVDDTLDLLDELFPVIAKVHKQKVGLTLQRAKGGRYFPILADRRYAKITDPIDDLFINPSSEFFQAEVKKTFVEFRKGGVKAVRLDFEGLTQHLADVVHYTTHWGPLNEIQRLTRNPVFRTAVESSMGKEVYAQFNPWLKNLARPSITKIDTIMGKARRNVTFANLAAVPVIAGKQTLSFITAMPKVGYTNAMSSLAEVLANPRVMLRAIKNASPEMANRRSTWNRDLYELIAEIKPTGTKSRILRAGYYMIHTMDEITASVVWRAGYKKGLTKLKGNGDLAVNYANRAVRGTQPASAPKDIPRIMREGEAYRALTMFYSYWSVFHGQVAEIISKGLAGYLTPAQVAGTLAWITIAPAVAQHLTRAAWNALTGREQEEEHLKEIAKGAALNVVAALPVARDISSAILKDYSYQVSPLMDVPLKTVDLGKTALKMFDEDEEIDMHDFETSLKLGSYWTLYPSKAMITAVRGGLRIYEGETDDWAELIDRPKFEK